MVSMSGAGSASRHGLRVVHSQPIFNKSHDGLGVFSDESGAILQSIREKLQVGKKSKIPNEILVRELQANHHRVTLSCKLSRTWKENHGVIGSTSCLKEAITIGSQVLCILTKCKAFS
ncbi:hypothetical protein MferCBS31731_007937 [Microsporum ferrugineum]